MKPRKYSSWSISRRRPAAASVRSRTSRPASGNALRTSAMTALGIGAGGQGDADGLAEQAARLSAARRAPRPARGVSTRGPSAKPRASRSGSADQHGAGDQGRRPTVNRSPSFRSQPVEQGLLDRRAGHAVRGAQGGAPGRARRQLDLAGQGIGGVDAAQLDQPALAGRRLGHGAGPHGVGDRPEPGEGRRARAA